MPDELIYEFDENLNKEKVFQYTPPPAVVLSDLAPPPKNWLKTLDRLCVRFDPGLAPRPVTKHLRNKYPSKLVLREHLLYIYYRLQGQLDAQLGCLSEDGYSAILYKLTEQITACTDGFHDRVHDIIASFFISNDLSLEQLLYCVRKKLVDTAAGELNTDDEIHTRNFVSLIAHIDGLGIACYSKEDRYSGLLSADQIRKRLAQEFRGRFRSLTIPILLSQELEQPLRKLGYIGKPEPVGGYTMQSLEAMEGYFKQLFSTSSSAPTPSEQTDLLERYEKYFIRGNADRDSPEFTDVKWAQMPFYFAQTLLEKNYLKQISEPTDLLSFAYHQTIFSQSDDFSVSELAKIDAYLAADFYAFSRQLQIISTYLPRFLQKLKAIQNIDAKMARLIADYLTITIENNLLLLEPVVEVSIVYDIMNLNVAIPIPGDFPPNALKLVSDNHAKHIKSFLGFILKHIPHIDSNIALQILQQQDNEENVFLMLSADYFPESLPFLLAFVNQHCGPDVPKQIFRNTSHDHNWNILIIAARYKPTLLEPLLAFLEQHKEIFDREILQDIVTNTSRDKWNILMVVTRYQPTLLESLLTFLAKHKEIFDREILQGIVTQKSNRGYNTFMLAVLCKPDVLPILFAFYSQHCDSEIIKKMFQEKNSAGRNVLMTAVRAQSEALKYLLNFLEQNHEIFNEEILNEMIQETDRNAWATVEQVARYYPTSLSYFLSFFIQRSQIIRSHSPPKLAKLLFFSLASLNTEKMEEQALLGQMVVDNWTLLWQHFSYHFFQDKPKNLDLVTKKLVDEYVNKLADRKDEGIASRGYGIFFNTISFRTHYSIADQKAAALQFRNILENPDHGLNTLQQVKKDYPALGKGKLGTLFKACCLSAKRDEPIRQMESRP